MGYLENDQDEPGVCRGGGISQRPKTGADKSKIFLLAPVILGTQNPASLDA